MALDTGQVDGTQDPGERQQDGFEPITTQEALDRIAASIRHNEARKYADYDELKAAAERLAVLEESSKTDLEKALARAEKAEAALESIKAEREAEALKAEVSEATGVKASLLFGSTKEELEAHAAAILEAFRPEAPAAPQVGSEGKRTAEPRLSGEEAAKAAFGKVLNDL